MGVWWGFARRWSHGRRGPRGWRFCTHHPEELDVFNAIFAALCLITFCRLDAHGLEAVGQRLDPDRAVIECRVVEGDPWWRKCGVEGVSRDTVVRQFAYAPFGHRPVDAGAPLPV